SSAWRTNLLVGRVGDGDLAAGLGHNAGFDHIPLASAHHRATHDRGDGARLYDRAYHHLFRPAVLGLCVHRQRNCDQAFPYRGDNLDHRADRIGGDLGECSGSTYGRKGVATATQCSLRGYGPGAPSLSVVARVVSGPVPDEWHVLLAHGLAGDGTT